MCCQFRFDLHRTISTLVCRLCRASQEHQIIALGDRLRDLQGLHTSMEVTCVMLTDGSSMHLLCAKQGVEYTCRA